MHSYCKIPSTHIVNPKCSASWNMNQKGESSLCKSIISYMNEVKNKRLASLFNLILVSSQEKQISTFFQTCSWYRRVNSHKVSFAAIFISKHTYTHTPHKLKYLYELKSYCKGIWYMVFLADYSSLSACSLCRTPSGPNLLPLQIHHLHQFPASVLIATFIKHSSVFSDNQQDVIFPLLRGFCDTLPSLYGFGLVSEKSPWPDTNQCYSCHQSFPSLSVSSIFTSKFVSYWLIEHSIFILVSFLFLHSGFCTELNNT